MAWFAVGVLLWMVVGLGVAVWQRRRGHHLLTWMVLGLVFGPLAAVLAVDAERGLGDAQRVAGGSDERVGPVDVLIGVDGSERAVAAARSALALFGDRIGRVLLVRVIDRETAIDPQLGRSRAVEDLERDLQALAVPGASSVVVPGRADKILSELAVAQGYDVVVVGAKGAGMSERFLGGVARRLVADSAVPVLIGGHPAATRAEASPGVAGRAGTMPPSCRSPSEFGLISG
ncbi:MAG: universal stress protein [Actinomycetota bacterium]